MLVNLKFINLYLFANIILHVYTLLARKIGGTFACRNCARKTFGRLQKDSKWTSVINPKIYLKDESFPKSFPGRRLPLMRDFSISKDIAKEAPLVKRALIFCLHCMRWDWRGSKAVALFTSMKNKLKRLSLWEEAYTNKNQSSGALARGQGGVKDLFWFPPLLLFV